LRREPEMRRKTPVTRDPLAVAVPAAPVAPLAGADAVLVAYLCAISKTPPGGLTKTPAQGG
jgi:hypothetical protein